MTQESTTGAAGAKSPAVVERSAFACGVAGEIITGEKA